MDEFIFKVLFKTVDFRYELFSRKFFCSKVISERYGVVREAVLKEFSEAFWCGIFIDLWRSDN